MSITFIVLIMTSVLVKSQPEVRIAGKLHNIMANGDLRSTMTLDNLKNYQHLYALGAIEGLAGEIIVLDGKIYNSRVKDKKLIIDEPLKAKVEAELQVIIEQKELEGAKKIVAEAKLAALGLTKEDLEFGLKLVKEGKIKPQLHKVLSLNQAGTAHQMLLNKEVKGNIVLSVSK